VVLRRRQGRSALPQSNAAVNPSAATRRRVAGRRQRQGLGLTRPRVRPIPRFAEPGDAGESFPCAFLPALTATFYKTAADGGRLKEKRISNRRM